MHRHLTARAIFAAALEDPRMKPALKPALCQRETHVWRTGCGIAGVRSATTFGGTSARSGVSV